MGAGLIGCVRAVDFSTTSVSFSVENFVAGTGSSYGWDTLYTGRLYDSETGMYQYRMRSYGAELGRFVGRDPIIADINSYGYVRNNPVVWVDPSGMADQSSEGVCVKSFKYERDVYQLTTMTLVFGRSRQSIPSSARGWLRIDLPILTLEFGNVSVDFYLEVMNTLSISDLPVPAAGQLPAPVSRNMPKLPITGQRGVPLPIQPDPNTPDSYPPVSMPGVLVLPGIASLSNADLAEMYAGNLNGKKCARRFKISAKCGCFSKVTEKTGYVLKRGTITRIELGGWNCYTPVPSVHDARKICSGK